MTAPRLFQIQADPPPVFHIVEGSPRVFLAITESRLFEIPESWDGSESPPDLAGTTPQLEMPPEPSAISLNVAQACNLSCAYCYADEGRFGGAAKLMSRETAFRAIDRLMESGRGKRASVGFIGGEPLLNREVVHDATRYAAARARQNSVSLSFGITTNATLLEPEDLDLFRTYDFAVTISIDGSKEANDRLRRTRGTSAYEAALSRVGPLLRRPGRARIAARCTLTAKDLNVAGRVEHLAEAGFPEVGVSPVRQSPDPDLALEGADWEVWLAAMEEAGEKDWERARAGGAFRFSNLAIALKQLDSGARRPLPCGSAVHYVSVSADGDYFTCHRTVGAPAFQIGSAESGPDSALRQRFAESRIVDTQEPCRSCWARYLCGGGCHAEVIAAGRAGCDAIRGWLEFCIRLYPHVLRERPELLSREDCGRG